MPWLPAVANIRWQQLHLDEKCKDHHSTSQRTLMSFWDGFHIASAPYIVTHTYQINYKSGSSPQRDPPPEAQILKAIESNCYLNDCKNTPPNLILVKPKPESGNITAHNTLSMTLQHWRNYPQAIKHVNSEHIWITLKKISFCIYVSILYVFVCNLIYCNLLLLKELW